MNHEEYLICLAKEHNLYLEYAIDNDYEVIVTKSTCTLNLMEFLEIISDTKYTYLITEFTGHRTIRHRNAQAKTIHIHPPGFLRTDKLLSINKWKVKCYDRHG